MTYSVALAIPAAYRDKANRLACAIGFDVLPGHTYGLPLSSSGSVTHYGTHTWAHQEFITMLQAAKAGTAPSGITWATYGITQQDVLDVAANVQTEIGDDPMVTWPALLARLGLTG